MAFLKARHTIHEICYDTAKVRKNTIVPKHNQYPRAGIRIQTVSPREVQGVTPRPSKNNFEIQEPSTFQKYVQNEFKNVQKLH